MSRIFALKSSAQNTATAAITASKNPALGTTGSIGSTGRTGATGHTGYLFCSVFVVMLNESFHMSIFSSFFFWASIKPINMAWGVGTVLKTDLKSKVFEKNRWYGLWRLGTCASLFKVNFTRLFGDSLTSRNFQVRIIDWCEKSAGKLREHLNLLGIELDTTGARGHAAKIERRIQSIKERVRTRICGKLPFTPTRAGISMLILYWVSRMNYEHPTSRPWGLTPREAFSGRKVTGPPTFEPRSAITYSARCRVRTIACHPVRTTEWWCCLRETGQEAWRHYHWRQVLWSRGTTFQYYPCHYPWSLQWTQWHYCRLNYYHS